MMLADDDGWVISDVGRPGVDSRLGGGDTVMLADLTGHGGCVLYNYITQ